MRRRIRSAAFPVPRPSVPQLVVDGILVALAYYLAFRLRFPDGLGGANHRYGDLLTHTLPWVAAVSLVTLALFGQYQRLWTFVGQRDYEAVVKGLVVATLVIVGGIAFLHPVTTTVAGQTTPVNLPGSVIALFFLLALALLIGARFLVHIVIEGRVHSFRVAKGARDVLIIGGGGRSGSSTTIPACRGARTSTASRCSAPPLRMISPGSSTKSSPTRS